MFNFIFNSNALDSSFFLYFYTLFAIYIKKLECIEWFVGFDHFLVCYSWLCLLLGRENLKKDSISAQCLLYIARREN